MLGGGLHSHNGEMEVVAGRGSAIEVEAGARGGMMESWALVVGDCGDGGGCIDMRTGASLSTGEMEVLMLAGVAWDRMEVNGGVDTTKELCRG